MTSYEEVRAAAEAIGEVNHVIYSVGVGSGKFGFPFWNLEPGDWARVIEINLIGAVNVAHAFAPKLIARRQGSMLFLVSVAGQIGSQTDPPYSAAKAGLINFMHCAAKDLAPYGIRVNALSPGMVQTGPNEETVWKAGRSESAAGTAAGLRDVGRGEDPQSVAARPLADAPATVCVRWPSSSPRITRKNITGQTIRIDGGQVMHA